MKRLSNRIIASTVIVLGLMGLGLVQTNEPAVLAQPAERPRVLVLIFDQFCDGMNLTIHRDSVTGLRTCCDVGRVIGSEFNNVISSGMTLRNLHHSRQWDIYRTGPLANKFFVFELPSGDLLHQGTWTEVEVGFCPVTGTGSSDE